MEVCCCSSIWKNRRMCVKSNINNSRPWNFFSRTYQGLNDSRLMFPSAYDLVYDSVFLHIRSCQKYAATTKAYDRLWIQTLILPLIMLLAKPTTLDTWKQT